MDGGYIKTFRAITEWEWYHDIYVHRLFSHLLVTVNWRSKTWQGMTIKAGQRVTSIGELSKETGLTVQQVRTALKKLTKTGEVTVCATNKFTLVTVENYTKYQGCDTSGNKQVTNKIGAESVEKYAKNQSLDTSSNKQEGFVTNKQQTNNKQFNKQINKQVTNKTEVESVESTSVSESDNFVANKQLTSTSTNKKNAKNQKANNDIRKEEIKNINNNKKEKEKEKEKEKVATLSPLFTEPVIEALTAYEEMRHKQKFTTTDRARQIYCNKLIDLASTGGTFDEALAVRIVDKAIEYGWRSFYPLKEDDRSSGKSFLDIDPNTPSDGHSFLDITPEMMDELPF